MHLNIFYVMCVCTLFYDTVYKRNILNAAEKGLTLWEHFTMKSDRNIRPLPTTASVMFVRSVKIVVKCAAQVSGVRTGWPTPCGGK